MTPRSLFLMQAIAVIGCPLVIWQQGAIPFIVRNADGRFMAKWISVSTLFPLAVIQILSGVLLGPSLLGKSWPAGYNFLFSPEVRHPIETIANLAIVLLVFIAGCETDLVMLKRFRGTLLKVGVAGVLVPWIMGFATAFVILWLFPTTGVIGTLNSPLLFSTAFGLCMCVTALPLLLILCREMDILRQPIGSIALALAGIADVFLWSSVAVMLSFATKGSGGLMSLLVAVGGCVALVLALVFVITPYMEWTIRKDARDNVLISFAVLVLFLASLTADLIGLHAAIGAYATGLLLPNEVRRISIDRLDTLVNVLLMPFFFAAAGLRTEFYFSDPAIWTIVAFGLASTFIGKLLGVSLPMWWSGQSAPFSIMLGVLMQCKGLMEILVVTVLRERGIIGDLTFSGLVMVALVSNAATSPLALALLKYRGSSAYTASGALASTAAPDAEDASVSRPSGGTA